MGPRAPWICSGCRRGSAERGRWKRRREKNRRCSQVEEIKFCYDDLSMSMEFLYRDGIKSGP